MKTFEEIFRELESAGLIDEAVTLKGIGGAIKRALGLGRKDYAIPDRAWDTYYKMIEGYISALPTRDPKEKFKAIKGILITLEGVKDDPELREALEPIRNDLETAITNLKDPSNIETMNEILNQIEEQVIAARRKRETKAGIRKEEFDFESELDRALFS